MRDFHGLRPQDILLLMKLTVCSEQDLMQKTLSDNLEISQTEISHGMKRLYVSRLLLSNNEVSKEAAIEFFTHALKYFFPAKLGPVLAGVPTAHTGPGFEYVKYNEKELYVWPFPLGAKRGVSIEPIYRSLPQACMEDEKLYILASLIEMIRVGRAREIGIASKEIKRLIKAI